MIYTTLRFMRENDPYKECEIVRSEYHVKQVIEYMRKEAPEDEPIPMVSVAKAIGAVAAMSYFPVCEETTNLFKQFVVWNAEQALPNFLEFFPDDNRPARDLLAAKRQAIDPLKQVLPCPAFQDTYHVGKRQNGETVQDPLDLWEKDTYKAAFAAQAAYDARVFTSIKEHPYSCVYSCADLAAASFTEGRQEFLIKQEAELLRLLEEAS